MKQILVQSHDWGKDIGVKDYKLPFSPARIRAVYKDKGYCTANPADIGRVVKTGAELMAIVGKPGGFQHCRLQILVSRV